jgi:hypothetical protein
MASLPASRPAIAPRGRHFPATGARRLRIAVPIFAVAFVALAIIGFGPSYYWAGMWQAPLRSTMAHVHGLAMTLWLGLFVTQVALASTGRIAAHRRLGGIVFALAPPIIATGFAAAVLAVGRGDAPPGAEPLAFFAIPMIGGAVVGWLLFRGWRLRGQPEWHRRTMIFASVAMLWPAIGRLPLLPHGGMDAVMFATALGAFATIAWADRRRLGRVHPATWGSGVPAALMVPMALGIGQLPIWQRFAELVAAAVA